MPNETDKIAEPSKSKLEFTSNGTVTFGISLVALVLASISFIPSSNNKESLGKLRQDVSAVESSVKNIDSNNAELSTKINTLADHSISQQDIETFIMDNPQVVLKSLTKFRMEQEAKLGATQPSPQGNVDPKVYADQLLNDAADPVIGNSNGKHVITVFADYNCGHCKLIEGVFEEWLSVDPEAKLIVKEFPINMGPTSLSAAIIGTALYKIDPAKYADFHQQAMKADRLTEDKVNRIMESIGVSVDEIKALQSYATKQIDENRSLGVKLNITGTPTMFINGSVRTGGSNHTVESLMSFF